MSSHIFGDVYSLSQVRKSLKALAKSNGRALAIDVARKIAPVLTGLMQEAFDSGITIFDESRPGGKIGALSLVDSGAIRRALAWAQAGTIVRMQLGPRNRKGVEYGKFLIGKYKIAPSGNQELPFRWQHILIDTANDEIARLAPGTQY